MKFQVQKYEAVCQELDEGLAQGLKRFCKQIISTLVIQPSPRNVALRKKRAALEVVEKSQGD